MSDPTPEGEAMVADELPIAQMLGDLLAVIHRDGGHRQSEIGIEQAWIEAMMAVPFMLDADAKYTALKGELAERETPGFAAGVEAAELMKLANRLCNTIPRDDWRLIVRVAAAIRNLTPAPPASEGPVGEQGE